MKFAPLCLFTNVFNFIKFSIALPMDLCFYTLNTSDCELPPTPVFTYYKPGSRCEIELWRGCPTYNMFDNEFECSHACIGRLNPSVSAENNEIEEESDQCKEPINLDDCGVEETEVYTFNDDSLKCEAVKWKGCETENKFNNKDSCKDACKHLMKDVESNLNEEVEEDEDEAEETGDGESKTGDEDKKSTENEESGHNDVNEKKSEDEEAKEEEEKKEEDAGTEKLKKDDDEDEGDPEETSSVRRSRGNKTLNK